MLQTRRATMHLGSVFILLVVAVVAESCDSETHYMKDGKCCKMCEPGKMMKETINCENPLCLDCADGEYQENYTKDLLCKRQPRCDSNLNLQTPVRSKTQRSPCVCKPNHHCSSQSCDSCVKNRVCKAGERVSKPASENNDVECTPCPNGTFSETESAAMCKHWTLCESGFKEVVPGTSTSDRECEVQSQKLAIVIPSVLIALLLVVVGCLGFIYYRRGKTGSTSFVKMAHEICDNRNTQKPKEDIVHVEIEPEPEPELPAPNQPQEDTDEDILKNEEPLLPGISEKGQPVIQDNSKSLLLSEAETEPGSFQSRL